MLLLNQSPRNYLEVGIEGGFDINGSQGSSEECSLRLDHVKAGSRLKSILEEEGKELEDENPSVGHEEEPLGHTESGEVCSNTVFICYEGIFSNFTVVNYCFSGCYAVCIITVLGTWRKGQRERNLAALLAALPINVWERLGSLTLPTPPAPLKLVRVMVVSFQAVLMLVLWRTIRPIAAAFCAPDKFCTSYLTLDALSSRFTAPNLSKGGKRGSSVAHHTLERAYTVA